MKACEVALEDCMVQNVEQVRINVFVIKMDMQITNVGMAIFEKMRNVLSKAARERLPPLRGIEKHRLFVSTRKADEIMNKIKLEISQD